jgi:DNA polymerase-3 subunit epsilon
MKNLVCIDIETTGLDKKNDHIIQLSAKKVDGDTLEELGYINYYIKPTVDFTIEEGAYEKHGLTKEFILKNGKPLSDISQEFINFIEGCNILSYNGETFDIPFIDKELLSIGIKIDWTNYNSIDVYNIEKKLTSRRLEDIYMKYTGQELNGSHNSLVDVGATIEVYKHQRELIDSNEFINKIISPDSVVKYDKNNQMVFTIGKYRGVDVYKVCKTDPQYIKWLFENGISETTKNSIKEYYKSIK